MAFILVTLFLDVLGLGIVIPVLPELVTDFLDGDASRAASYYGLLASSFALMQFLFAPVLGALSDRFGRRPVLLIALFGFGVNYLILAWAPTLAWLFLARAVSGIMGASFTTAHAYIADISTPQNRAANFGLAGAAFGLGFIFGPALGGLLGHWGPRVPFLVSAGIVLINWLYGLLILPESLPPERRRKVTLREANPLGGIALLGKYPLVAGLAVTFVLVSLAQRGMESIWVLYTHYRYGWEELQNGLALALVGLMGALVQGVLVRRVVPRLGERRAILISLTIATIAYVLYGFAFHPAMLLTIIFFGALAGIGPPAIQSLVAGTVSPREQGATQGALTSLMSMTAIVAPLITTQLFSACTGDDAVIELPGIPFFAGALFMALSLPLLLRTFRRNPPPATGPGGAV